MEIIWVKSLCPSGPSREKCAPNAKKDLSFNTEVFFLPFPLIKKLVQNHFTPSRQSTHGHFKGEFWDQCGQRELLKVNHVLWKNETFMINQILISQQIIMIKNGNKMIFLGDVPDVFFGDYSQTEHEHIILLFLFIGRITSSYQ